MGIYSSLPHAVAPHSWQAWNYPECKQCSQQSAKWWQSDQPVYTCHSVVSHFPTKCCTSLCNVFCKGDKSRGTKKVNSQRPEVNKWRTSQCSHLLLINYTIMWKPTCAASLFILPHDKECWMSYFATGFFSHQKGETAEWNRRKISVRKHTLHFRNADAICPERVRDKRKGN